MNDTPSAALVPIETHPNFQAIEAAFGPFDRDRRQFPEYLRRGKWMPNPLRGIVAFLAVKLGKEASNG